MRKINFSRSIEMTDDIFNSLYPANQLLAALGEAKGVKIQVAESTKTKGVYYLTTDCLKDIYEAYAK